MTVAIASRSIQDAEDAVLSAILLDPVFAVQECHAVQLSYQAFSDQRNALLYRVMLYLHREGKSVDPITIAAALEPHGKLDDAGGRDHIYLLLNAVPTAANVRHWAQLVKNAHELREGNRRSEHEAVQAEQVRQAQDRLDLPDSAYLHFPYHEIDKVMGGHGPGSVGFICARSASGKTSLLLSCMTRWHKKGLRVYYAGLESRPMTLRTQWACRVLGLDPGDILSGAYRNWPDANETRERIRAELERQKSDAEFLTIRFAPHESVDLAAMTQICVEAHEFGADVIIVDHIDHVKADGAPYVASRAVVDVALKLAQRYDQHLLLASQINREGMSTDPFRNHRPVREEHVKMGDHKLEVADYMLGVYRPLRDDISKTDRADFADGQIQIGHLLQPNTMALNVMKHRLYGARAGTKIALGFWRGEVLDYPDTAQLKARVAMGVGE